MKNEIEQAIAKIEQISKITSDLTTITPALQRVAENDIAQRFGSSPRVRTSAQVYGGAFWRRLSEPYLRANPHRSSGNQLIDTSELRNSFALGGSGNVATSSPNKVVFGSSLSKALWMNSLGRALVVEHDGLVTETERAVEEELGKVEP